MRTIITNHPLILHKLSILRDKNTSSYIFRQLTEELVTLLAYEATRNVQVVKKQIKTPISETIGVSFRKPAPLVVPILRAGLGMLSGMVKLVPTAEIGFLGMARNEKTLEIKTYIERIPDTITDNQVFVLDPMLATGGTLIETIKFLFAHNAKDITCICLLAAPEGLQKIEKEFNKFGNKLTIVVASIDDRLNEKSYIVPGLGDAGDRLYGRTN